MFAVAQIVFSPFNSKLKEKLGAKNAVIYGLVLQVLTITLQGVLVYVKNAYYYLWLSCFLRFL